MSDMVADGTDKTAATSRGADSASIRPGGAFSEDAERSRTSSKGANDSLALELVVAYGPTSPATDGYLDAIRDMDVEVQTWPHQLNGFTRFAVPDSFEADVVDRT
jgi:hypothetical protein